MKFVYNDASKLPGIYKIINTHTNRIYVGQAKEFKERWKNHASSLRSNKHQNKYLRHDYAKCLAELGNDDFLEFHVVEVMVGSTKEQRNKREEELIAQHFDKQDLCYNFKQVVNNAERSCFSHTPEQTSRKISESSKRRWSNKEWATKQRDSLRKITSDPEVQERKRQGQLKSWSENPERKTQASVLMKKRMSEPGEFRDNAVARLAANQPRGRVTYKTRMKNDLELRKKMQEVGRTNIAIRNSTQPVKTYGTLQAPDGTIYENVSHVPTFAKTHGLTKQHVYRLLNMKSRSCKGWTLVST